MGIPQVLEYADSILRWHDVFLRWIERQRAAMDPRPPTPVELRRGNQDTSASRPRDEPSNTRAAVVGLPKSMPQSANLVPKDTDLAFPNSPLQILQRWKTKPRCIKENALAQFSPHRVAKTNRLGFTRTEPHAGTQRSSARQSRAREEPSMQSKAQRRQCFTPRKENAPFQVFSLRAALHY
jgi:hypothetical protein